MAIEDVTEIVPEVATITPFQKLVLSIGEIPTNYLDSMTYAEQVTWFCMFLQEKVLPVVNQHSEKILEIINYLNNLDLQDEVNNKLDEMTESGQLQEIIADYLNSKAIFGFDNVQSMKEATNLISGSYASTLGYYEINDGGKSTYKIRDITNEDIVDEMTIIPLANENLIAELVYNSTVNIKQLGAKGNGTNDDSDYLIKALSICNTVIFDKGTYLINKPININKDNITLKGNTFRSSIISFTTNGYLNFEGTSILNSGTHRQCLTIDSLYLRNNDNSLERTTPFINLICCDYVKILNSWIYGKGKQILMWECFDSKITDTDIEWGGSTSSNDLGIELRSQNGGNSSLPTYEYTNNIYFYGCRFESHIGRCIGNTGQNTNKIIFESCKFESSNVTNNNAIRFVQANNIYFNDCIFAGRQDNTDNYVRLSSVNDFKISGYGEHIQQGTYSGKRLFYLAGSGKREVDLSLNVHGAYTVDAKTFGIDTYENGIYIDGFIKVNTLSNQDLMITNRGLTIATLTNGDTTLNYEVLENGFVNINAVGTYGSTTPQYITIKNNHNNFLATVLTIGDIYVQQTFPVSKGDVLTCTKNTTATAYISIKYNKGNNLN